MAEPMRPEVDVLADYVEGLLDVVSAAEVERHIAEDPDTAALVAELESLPGLLAATPVEPMPPDIVARVDAALERESQDRAAAPVPGLAVGTRLRRRWLAPALSAAAIVGVVAVAGPVVLDGGDQGASEQSSGDTSAAQEGGAAGEDSSGAMSAPQDEHVESPSPRTTGEPPALTSAAFVPQVEALYAGAGQLTPEEVDGTSVHGYERVVTLPAERLSDSDIRVAPVCSGRLESTLRTAIALDGKPAYLLVYDEPTGGGPQQALAFRCRGDVPTILEQQPVDLP